MLVAIALVFSSVDTLLPKNDAVRLETSALAVVFGPLDEADPPNAVQSLPLLFLFQLPPMPLGLRCRQRPPLAIVADLQKPRGNGAPEKSDSIKNIRLWSLITIQ